MQVRRFARDLVHHWSEDGIQDIGAMMAYYAVLALFPMLVFTLAIAMLVLPQDVIQQGVQMASAAIPAAARQPIVARIDAFVGQPHGTFAIVGAALALWGAKGGMSSLMTALNRVYHRKETRSWLKRQLVALAVTAGVGLLSVSALALLLVGPIGSRIAEHFGLGDAFAIAWEVGRWLGAGLLLLVVWAIIYRFIPDTNLPFRLLTPGAITGVVLWLGTSYLFGLYLGHFGSYEATYGALGGAIIFLTWLWLSNMALLLGAAINDVLASYKGYERDFESARPAEATREDHVPPGPAVPQAS